MKSERKPTYEFGDFRFDANGGFLQRHGTPVPLAPKVASLLEALIEHRGRVVAKSELMEMLWPDTFVQEQALHVYMFELRRALGQQRGHDMFVETVPRRGYRFAHPVTVRGGSELDHVLASESSRARPIQGNVLHGTITSLVGRLRETEHVASMVRTHRLVTLTGTGGIGKTRLALEVAGAMREEFADGIWFIELTPINDPQLIAGIVAAILEVKDELSTTPDTAVRKRLGKGRALLVLDNCEHVIEECGNFTASLLEACPQVHVLATSRQPFDVGGESVFVVPPLSVPIGTLPASPDECASFEAVRMFRDRAALTSPGFDLDTHNARTVAGICQHLDGIPLAIELAAARVRVLAIDQIFEMLDHRFRLLTTLDADAPERQRTLRATIDWSYSLLGQKERITLERLSVFQGGCTLGAAEFVCSGCGVNADEILDLVSHLVDKSLVNADTRHKEARYSMFESIRDYARERLTASGIEAAVRWAHHEWFAQLAERSCQGIFSADQEGVLAALRADRVNLDAAITWVLREASDGEMATKLCASLYRYWDLEGQLLAGRRWIDEALMLVPDLDSDPVTECLFGHATLSFSLGDLPAARRSIERCLEMRRDHNDAVGIARALNLASLVSDYLGVYEVAIQMQEESLAISRVEGLTDSINQGTFHLGLLALRQGSTLRARELLEASAKAWDASGNRLAAAGAKLNLAEAERLEGDFQRADAHLDEAVAVAAAMGVKSLHAACLTLRASLMIDCSQDPLPCLREAAILARDSGSLEREIEIVETLAINAARNGNVDVAWLLERSAAGARGLVGMPRDPVRQLEFDTCLVGRPSRKADVPMTLEDAIAFGLERDSVSNGESHQERRE